MGKVAIINEEFERFFQETKAELDALTTKYAAKRAENEREVQQNGKKQ